MSRYWNLRQIYSVRWNTSKDKALADRKHLDICEINLICSVANPVICQQIMMGLEMPDFSRNKMWSNVLGKIAQCRIGHQDYFSDSVMMFVDKVLMFHGCFQILPARKCFALDNDAGKLAMLFDIRSDHGRQAVEIILAQWPLWLKVQQTNVFIELITQHTGLLRINSNVSPQFLWKRDWMLFVRGVSRPDKESGWTR